MAGLLSKAANNKEVKSSNKDHKGIVEETTSKKRALTTIKMQKEAAK